MANNSKYKWIDLTKLTVGTEEYAKAVYEKYGIQSYEMYKADKVQQHRKVELLKLEGNIIDRYFIRLNINQYENRLKLRDLEVITGRYANNRDITYKANYIKCLHHYGIPQSVIDVVNRVPAANFKDYFPPLKDYYIYLYYDKKTKKGNKYKIDLGLQDDFLKKILDTLILLGKIDKDFYNYYVK